MFMFFLLARYRDDNVIVQRSKMDLKKLYQGLRRRPELENRKLVVVKLVLSKKLRNSFFFKKLLRFLLLKRLQKKRVLFFKVVKLKLLRKIKRLIFRKYRIHFVPFFLKKYHPVLVKKLAIASIFQKFSIGRPKLSRFTTKLYLNKQKIKALALLRTSVSFLNSKTNRGHSFKFFASCNNMPVVAKSTFRDNRHIVNKRRTSLFLTKLSSIVACKGNNRSVYSKLLVEINTNRSSVFIRTAGLFLRKKLVLSSGSGYINNNMLSQRNYQALVSVKLSLLVRQILGVCYYLRNKISKKKSDIIGVKTFNLPRLKKIFLTSSPIRINSIFRPFLIYFDIKSWKKGGRSLLVPVPLKSTNRRFFLFSHWVKMSVLSRSEYFIQKKIFGELIDISIRRGSTIKRLMDMHKTVRANRALVRKAKISIS